MSSKTATILQAPTTVPIRSSLDTCQHCGADLSHLHPGITEDAQTRIAELETQVKILTDKATAAGKSKSALEEELRQQRLETDEAMTLLTYKMYDDVVDKLADYEDDFRKLKGSQQPPDPRRNSAASSESQPEPRPSSATNTRNPLQSRLSYLLPSSRRSMSQPPSSAPATSKSPPSPVPSESADLLTLLTREQSLRQAAETRVNQTNNEIEELSAQLFTEANEMVAAERKARAKLEQRVLVLERRDGEKRARLEVLEKRLGRIERVRGLLKKEEE